MRKQFDAPELMPIGQADEVVMGIGGSGNDVPWEFAPDFEFEQD